MPTHPSISAQLMALHRQRIGARDHGLRGNHRGGDREHDHRVDRPGGCQQIERVLGGRGVLEQQSPLPEVVEQQRRKDDGEPDESNGARAEVPHVRVQRFAPRDHEEDRAEDEISRPPRVEKEADGVHRVDRREHRRLAQDLHQAEERQHREPQQRHRTENPADPRGAAALDEKERDENRDGDRDDVRTQRGRGDAETLHRAEHRDRGRDEAVAIQQRGAEQSDQEQGRSLLPARWRDRRRERRERENAALAMVVGAEHEYEVLDGDDDDERPEDERQDAEDVIVGRLDGVRPVKALAERIERARADVTVDDAEGEQTEGGEVPSRDGLGILP
jgi:hypothetical protein